MAGAADFECVSLESVQEVVSVEAAERRKQATLKYYTFPNHKTYDSNLTVEIEIVLTPESVIAIHYVLQ
jgi:hypothetical protein